MVDIDATSAEVSDEAATARRSAVPTMARSVVLSGSPRCESCQLPPRWCICGGFEPVPCPFQVNILIHHREFWRPTSTGRLIQRVVPDTRVAVYRYDVPLAPAAIGVDPDRPLWILHPQGTPLPDGPPPDGLQVLLLDGAWREATRMVRAVERWGTRISLPMTGPSRYWLRGQQGAGNHSTIEALLFLLRALGFHPAHAALQRQFELQVYAGLRARGDTVGAAEYLANSPIATHFSDLLEQLQRRRPRF